MIVNCIYEPFRKGSIDDFILYMNQKNNHFNSTIKPSINETNIFILKKRKARSLNIFMISFLV